MPHVQTLVDTLTHYKTLPHHQDAKLAHVLQDIQTWQKQRIRKSHNQLFTNPQTAALADILFIVFTVMMRLMWLPINY